MAFLALLGNLATASPDHGISIGLKSLWIISDGLAPLASPVRFKKKKSTRHGFRRPPGREIHEVHLHEAKAPRPKSWSSRYKSPEDCEGEKGESFGLMGFDGVAGGIFAPTRPNQGAPRLLDPPRRHSREWFL